MNRSEVLHRVSIVFMIVLLFSILTVVRLYWYSYIYAIGMYIVMVFCKG